MDFGFVMSVIIFMAFAIFDSHVVFSYKWSVDFFGSFGLWEDYAWLVLGLWI